MITLDVKGEGYKGQYYASVEFAKMDGGKGSYKHINKSINPHTTRWEVVNQNLNGSYNVRDMSESEYEKYINA